MGWGHIEEGRVPPPTIPTPDPPRELKTLCEEEEEGRAQHQQAGEAQAQVGTGEGMDLQPQGPGLSTPPFLPPQLPTPLVWRIPARPL